MNNQLAIFAVFVLAVLAAIAAGIYIGYHTHPLLGIGASALLITGIYRAMDASMIHLRRARKATIVVTPQPFAKF